MTALRVIRQRKQMVAAGKRAGYEFQRCRINNDIGEINALGTQIFRQRIPQCRLGNKTQRDQNFSDRLIFS